MPKYLFWKMFVFLNFKNVGRNGAHATKLFNHPKEKQ